MKFARFVLDGRRAAAWPETGRGFLQPMAGATTFTLRSPLIQGDRE